MKLIAHRGWCEGAEENTPAAFVRAASDPRIAGVEIDVRRASDGGPLVVSHDPPVRGRAPLTLDDALSLLAPTPLDLLVEIKEAGIAEDVIATLAARGVADHALVFAFAPVARSFPVERAAAGAARHHRRVSLADRQNCCPARPRRAAHGLGRARLDAGRVSRLVVPLLARGDGTAPPPCRRGGRGPARRRSPVAYTPAHPRGGCRYRSALPLRRARRLGC